MQTRDKKWGYLLVLSLIWGSSFILIKKALIGLTPLQLGALRILISGAFIFLAGFKTIKTIEKSQWKWLFASGLLGSFFPVFLFAFAETEIDSTIASILNSLTPLHTILIGVAVFKIASTTRQIIGVVLGFLGTCTLIGAGAQLNPNQNYMYAVLVIISSIMYAVNVNIIKRHLQDMKAITIAVGNFAAIMLPALIVLVFTGFFSRETFVIPELKMALFYVLILSVFGTALAKVLFNQLVQMSTPVFASSVTYVIPIVALIWGVLDGEYFNSVQGLATLLIFSGVYLVNKSN
ncbi:MAG: EamA family transporter [Flavobacteriaceae bacterium]|nr:EamA family transporter [Flavobacteriaceae bacterium]